MFIKQSYSDDQFEVVDFLQKKFKDMLKKVMNTPEILLMGLSVQIEPRGGPEVKQRDLMELCSSMPVAKRDFFSKLSNKWHGSRSGGLHTVDT